MNIKTLASLALLSGLLSATAIQAADNCATIKGGAEINQPSAGVLVFGNCIDTWSKLGTSGRFPDIFASTPAKLIPGLCFVSSDPTAPSPISPGFIAAQLNNTPVNVSTASAWTTEFLPAAFGLGNDNMGTVLSQWVVRDSKYRLLGTLYTRDAIDLQSSSEYDAIVGGSGKFQGARGAVRVDSHIVPSSTGQIEQVVIDNINGTVCVPD